jgi:hypothetical protein
MSPNKSGKFATSTVSKLFDYATTMSNKPVFSPSMAPSLSEAVLLLDSRNRVVLMRKVEGTEDSFKYFASI